MEVIIMERNSGYIKYEGYGFKKTNDIPEPTVNVINKETFERVVSGVFDTMAECLEPSLGPSGGATAISNFPYFHSTKDGFTIMKNVEFSDPIHKIVAMVIQEICTRLNNTVGDGTTTAIVATNALYQTYFDERETFFTYRIRDVLDTFNFVKNTIIDYIKTNLSTPIGVETGDFVDNIRKIVSVSTNGDETLTEIITNLYDELRCPAIEVTMGNGGDTVGKIIEGFQIDTCLTDQIYINNDEKTLKDSHIDVIVFDHKITAEIYNKFIRPLNVMCFNRKRRLMVIAPFYDEVLLNKTIAAELSKEYSQRKTVNLILMRCSATSAMHKKKLSDLAMLLNTEIITNSIEALILEQIDTGNTMETFINIDDRQLMGTVVIAYDREGNPYQSIISPDNIKKSKYIKGNDYVLRVGHVDSVNAGLKKSVFSGFYYDEELYQKHVDDAETALEEAVEKYSKLGTFNTEITACRSRLNSLKLKLGIIEVGGDSLLSQNFIKDTVDDAVHAAESAYNNGYILGGNVTILIAVDEILNSDILERADNPELAEKVCMLISKAFTTVYRKVLRDIPNYDIHVLFKHGNYVGAEVVGSGAPVEYGICEDVSISEMEFTDIIGRMPLNGDDNKYPYGLCDFIILMSYINHKVFDLRTNTFTTDVINSTQTDIEILNATLDLLALLISGNQLIVRGRSEYAE